MKQISTILFLFFSTVIYSQRLFPVKSIKITNAKSTKPEPLESAKPTTIDSNKAINNDSENEVSHIIEIQGLGNIANSQNGSSLSPSASIYTSINLLPNNRNAKLSLGYNLGSEIDSTKIDSISLGNLFLPDRSKSGYIARFEYDISDKLKFIKNDINANANGYVFYTAIIPFIEYNYNKINIKGVVIDSSKIQTSTWILGINLSHTITTKDNNIIGLQLTPYYKTVNVSIGTIATYKSIFRKALSGNDPPRTVNFIGLNFGLQVNRFLFSFVYENLVTSTLQNTSLYGGVFTLRATVIGDFLKL